MPKPQGTRPVLLLSRDIAYKVRSAVIVAPMTTTIRSNPVEVRLGPEDGLPKECVVNLDDITTLNRRLIKSHITTLSHAKMGKVREAIKFALDLYD
jgi:mRNA interferase MazF